jgi:hypothetical protein
LLNQPGVVYIALEGLDASSTNAADDEIATMSPTSNLNAGSIAMQTGISKVVAVELVITFARTMARKPKMDIKTMLLRFRTYQQFRVVFQ